MRVCNAIWLLRARYVQRIYTVAALTGHKDGLVHAILYASRVRNYSRALVDRHIDARYIYSLLQRVYGQNYSRRSF